MAWKNPGHREQVFQSQEYRRMVSEWIAAGSPVPLAVFQKSYSEAFFSAKGEPQKPEKTLRSREAFVNLMKWTDRAPEEVEDWDDWLEFNEY